MEMLNEWIEKNFGDISMKPAEPITKMIQSPSASLKEQTKQLNLLAFNVYQDLLCATASAMSYFCNFIGYHKITDKIRLALSEFDHDFLSLSKFENLLQPLFQKDGFWRYYMSFLEPLRNNDQLIATKSQAGLSFVKETSKMLRDYMINEGYSEISESDFEYAFANYIFLRAGLPIIPKPDTFSFIYPTFYYYLTPMADFTSERYAFFGCNFTLSQLRREVAKTALQFPNKISIKNPPEQMQQILAELSNRYEYSR